MLTVVTVWLLVGCGGAQKSAAPENVAAPVGAAPACTPLDGDPDATYAELHALTANASWEQRYKLAVAAARSGDPEGQSHAGGMKFSMLFEEEPDPANASQREQYVQALTWLFSGALRGAEYARTYAPGLDTIAAQALPAELETPLGDVPRPWLEAGFAAARAWIACHVPRQRG